MILTFRPIKVWPEGWDRHGMRPYTDPFKATWERTLSQLETELGHLGASDPVLQVDVGEEDLKLDGTIRSRAAIDYPGVILSFDTKEHGTLTYSCNAFFTYKANLRAITLGLADLRRLERYGIAKRGEQYAGWAELPSGIALGTHQMTVEEAAQFLSEHSPFTKHEVLIDKGKRAGAFRSASRRLHPDNGGDAEQFHRLTQARDLLTAS